MANILRGFSGPIYIWIRSFTTRVRPQATRFGWDCRFCPSVTEFYTARMAAIKAKLVSNHITTPLFNTELFTQHREAGYQQAYDRYLEGKAPDVIEVTMPV